MSWRKLGQDVARAAGGRKPLTIDPSLERAAVRHAEAILRTPVRATSAEVRRALRAEGLADAILLPFSGMGPDRARLGRAALDHARRAKPRGMTHVGLGFAQTGDRHALVLILSRRLVSIAPLARRPRREPLTVRGRALPGVTLQALSLGPCRTDLCFERGVQTLTVQRKKDLFSFRVPLDRGAGATTIEVVAVRDRGPEIAALWTFETKRPTAAAPLPSTSDDAAGLARLIAAARDRADRAPLERSKLLDEVAAQHARRVCQTGIAAHVLDGADPVARVRAAGHTGGVAENVAIAPSVSVAHQNFLESPSHRMNVLAPVAFELGLGVVRRDEGVCVVELYGR